MIPVLSVENMRRSDARTIELGTSGRELMYRAGEGIFHAVSWKPPVAVICGGGNNAGDGFVIASLLHKSGIDCTVILLSDRFSPDGKYYFDRCVQDGVKVKKGLDTLSGFSTVADCIFGTGFHGSVTGEYANAMETINAFPGYVVSVDINSGLSGDSGMAELCVRSDLTVSVGGYQPGHFLNMAKDVMKEKKNLDIGILPCEPPCQLVEREDLLLPERKHFSHKGTYGYTALIGGSLPYSGAIRLAAMANAAMRSGAGVVKIGAPESLCPLIAPAVLESTLFPLPEKDGSLVFCEEKMAQLCRGVKTVAFGMGAGISQDTEKILTWLMTCYTGILIVDADGLTALSRLDRSLFSRKTCRMVLTPHVKEFARLAGCDIKDVQDDPVAKAKKLAQETDAVVLLKGAATLVTDGLQVLLTDAGCPGMATAGSGDVLSGILAACCGFIPDLMKATVTAAYINGKAGELAQRAGNPVSMVAGDTVAQIGKAVGLLIGE